MNIIVYMDSTTLSSHPPQFPGSLSHRPSNFSPNTEALSTHTLKSKGTALFHATPHYEQIFPRDILDPRVARSILAIRSGSSYQEWEGSPGYVTSDVVMPPPECTGGDIIMLGRPGDILAEI